MLRMSSYFRCFWLTAVLEVVLISRGQGQMDDCPRAWLDNGQSCYLFALRPPLTVQQAEMECMKQHGHLLSVDTVAENTFVGKWLMAYDSENRQKWLTSGRRKGGRFVWTSDGSDIKNDLFPDNGMKEEIRKDEKTDTEFDLVVYRYDASTNVYLWDWGRLMTPMAYICEIQKKDLWKVYQLKRDFSFGTDITDPNMWPVAPKIRQLSRDVVFFKRTPTKVTPVDLDCVATGNPPPTYKWFRQSVVGVEELTDNSHFTIINGKLSIPRPDIESDAATYFCQASNSHGTVLSDKIRLSYGKLDEFPNVRPGHYTSKLYMGIEIDCQPPNYKPDARFNWFKGSVMKFIRPELNPQMFLSRNGKLYISEVATHDAGDYFCAVHLAPRPGERLASGQTVTRNSMAIRLTVQGDNANTYGPDIQDKFPQVFPRIPLVGQKLMLECLAYGRLPLQYDWVREDGPMNPKAYKRDRNRVLVIDEALLQDSGTYTCLVSGVKSSMNRTRYVKLSGLPSFPLPLQNQFLDAGSPFTWSCFSQGIPTPTYTWYKDGKKLMASDDDLGITVRGRHLTFESVTDKNNGVYECEATNSLGSRRSSAQVTAMSFAPTFARNPIKSSHYATQGGRVTVSCRPEGAPRPTVSWSREDGRALSNSNRVLPNGDLELSDLKPEDSGTYVCEATNSLGSSKSSGVLTVSDKTVLEEEPLDDEVTINGTTTFRCKASYDRTRSDVIYSWKFYSHVINWDRDVAYTMPYVDKGSGSLYLLSAQYKHEGKYTCVASTVTDSVEASAYLLVQGPPEAPLGVHQCKTCAQGPTSLELRWMPGRIHKFPITHYVIEVHSDLDEGDQWTVIRDDVSEEDSKINTETQTAWRSATVSEGLSPGGTYRFRIKAGNPSVGYSPPSKPSPSYTMAEAAPVFAPSEVGGGGGKERELEIKWKPLPRSQWGSDHIRYIVYYRLKGETTWLKSDKELTKNEFHTVVPAKAYYSPFEVKVQTLNDLGRGPNSTTATVMSAEKMPTFSPSFTQANAINSTAGTVEWQPVENSRENLQGSIFAFQVNYWLEDTKCLGKFESTARFTRVYGDVASADVIGLMPGADYCVNIQFLNHAGMGPKTENNYLGMNDPAPGRYPEYVQVMSHGPDSVMVTWRGIVNQFGESPLVGYKAWYWKLQEDIRSAKKKDFGRSFRGIIKGIEKNEIYKLRMMGYSLGGEGKKAPDILFTLGGMVNFNPLTTDVMNDAHRHLYSQVTLVVATGLVTLFVCV